MSGFINTCRPWPRCTGGWLRTSSRPRSGLGALTTVRYAISDRKVAGAQVRATVRRLDQRTDPVFVDLAVAAYCALAVEAVTPEATRLLLDAHRHRPISTTSAVLVGTALALAEREP